MICAFKYLVLTILFGLVPAADNALTGPALLPASLNITPTLSGKSRCLEQLLKVDVTSNNIKILLDPPANQTIVTETLVELLQANSTLFSRVNGGPSTISNTFEIYAKLCLPANPSAVKAVKTVQFLTHGDTLDSTYWDIAPGYSYIDAAVAAGYATFSYDRIGVGKSQHPDPLQVIQGPLQVEIAHALITRLRQAQISSYNFTSVIGVGHSAGSTVTQGVTTKYPQDFDSVILTGTSTSIAFVNVALASYDLSIANLDPSRKFSSLPNGYLVQPNTQSIQFSNFRWPNFNPIILGIEVANKQTQTFGELLTLGLIVAPSLNFTGPVDVLLGENDFVFCGGDCTQPQDQSALVVPALYPSARNNSQQFIVLGAGHFIFAHYSAGRAFSQMITFLQQNGF
ncbi:MAG: hypothetical protein Q9195_005759 [Heterodermia aff. obscurata]